jgi:DNA sulfur modification protein DndB
MKNETLFLPALRASMGDWTYYATIMKFKDVKERVEYAEDIHKSQKLQEYIQRELTPRADEISNYIINQPQRFFNSLIVGVYGGEPEWVELKISESDVLPEFPISQRGILGFLKLSGEETLFALDGQHRVAGIRGALNKEDTNSLLNDEEISVIFIGHKRTPKGLERTRRLFTTLNRYAKPVKLSEIIALDEDDISAIITRELIDEYKLFTNNRISLSKTTSISNKDEKCFTNIVTLYKTIDMTLPVFLRNQSRRAEKWGDFKKKRPEQEIIDSSTKFIRDLWDKIIEQFPALVEYLQFPESDRSKAERFRNRGGGHILFRPIGLLIYFRTISRVLKDQFDIDKLLYSLSKINTDLNNPPWQGLLWGGARKGMITDKINQDVAGKLIFYMIGFDLKKVKSSEKQLQEEYASALNKKIEDVSLPNKV